LGQGVLFMSGRCGIEVSVGIEGTINVDGGQALSEAVIIIVAAGQFHASEDLVAGGAEVKFPHAFRCRVKFEVIE